MRIYLVERDTLLRQTLQEFLRALGHEVLVVSGLDGLLTLPAQPHPAEDLLLIGGSPVDGELLRLLSDLHQRYANLLVMMVTDVEAVLPVERAVGCGVYGYVRKPVRLAEVELLLIRLAERQRTSS